MPAQNFVVFTELEQQAAGLSDAQMGQLFRAMFRYHRGEAPDFRDPMVELAFAFVRPAMDRNREKYEETCRRNRENGKKGGRPAAGQEPPASEKTHPVSPKPEKANPEPKPKPEPKPEPNPDPNPDPDPERKKSPSPAGPEAGAARGAGSGSEVERSFFRVLGRRPTAAQGRELARWAGTLGEGTVTQALETARARGRPNWSYVQGILRNWQAQGRGDPPPGPPKDTRAENLAYLEQMRRLLALGEEAHTSQ